MVERRVHLPGRWWFDPTLCNQFIVGNGVTPVLSAPGFSLGLFFDQEEESMRTVEKQKLGAGELTITALDERGKGGDNHVYVIAGASFENNPSRQGLSEEAGDALDALIDDGKMACYIVFQDGNPAAGLNGVTIESLLAVCADRLAGCQAGPYACRENDKAAHHIRSAIRALEARQSSKRLAEFLKRLEAEPPVLGAISFIDMPEEVARIKGVPYYRFTDLLGVSADHWEALIASGEGLLGQENLRMPDGQEPMIEIVCLKRLADDGQVTYIDLQGRPVAGEPEKKPAHSTRDTIKSLVNRLMTLTACMSYDDSYCGEPAGRVKSDVMDWERRGGKPSLAEGADRAAPIKPMTETVGIPAYVRESQREAAVADGESLARKLEEKLGGSVTYSRKTGNLIHHPYNLKPEDRQPCLIDREGVRIKDAPKCPACDHVDWLYDKVHYNHRCGSCGNEFPF